MDTKRFNTMDGETPNTVIVNGAVYKREARPLVDYVKNEINYGMTYKAVRVVGDLLLIPLPNANMAWTEEVMDFAVDFYEEYGAYIAWDETLKHSAMGAGHFLAINLNPQHQPKAEKLREDFSW